MEAGLNLFSLKDFIQTEQGLIDTAIKIKGSGYSYVQYSGAVFDVLRIDKMKKESGLNVVLTHVPMQRFLNDTDRLMDEHLMIDCRNIGLGALPFEYFENDDELRRVIGQLNDVAIKMENHGFHFFYHNHQFEFTRMSDGICVFDYILKNAGAIHLTLDTYWVQYGGADVLEYTRKAKGRIQCVHLKDYAIVSDEEKRFVPDFAPIGDGNLNFRSIIQTMRECGTEYYLFNRIMRANSPILLIWSDAV